MSAAPVPAPSGDAPTPLSAAPSGKGEGPPSGDAPTPLSAVVRLKPGGERRLLAGHPWVFSNEIAQGAGRAGDVLEAVSATGRSLGFGSYNPHSLIAWRLISRRPVAVDAVFFRARLSTALSLRERIYPGETSYRLCFGESDGLPGLVVDRYGDVISVEILSAAMERRVSEIGEALAELLRPRCIFLKNDHRARVLEGLPTESRVLFGEVPQEMEIREGDLRFLVNIAGGQKTGCYFDQRENRAFLRPYFKDRVVLDLYCYTGAFSLHAARAGARRVLGVDSSGPAIALAARSAELNSLAAARFQEGDAAEALEDFGGPGAAAPAEGAGPDMILLDPPSLAPSRKDLPRALRAYERLNALALRALPPEGLLATSSCSHHLSREAFVEMLRAASSKARRRVRLVALRGQAADHPILLAMPETEYLHFALLEILP